MSGPTSAEIDRLRVALRRISRRLDRQVAGDGLTQTQLSVLASVALQGPLGLGELADLEGVNPTMLSRVVGKLEESGLIRRQVAPDDRRAVRVEVTEYGAALRARMMAERSLLLNKHLTALRPEEVEQIVKALPALEALAAHVAHPVPPIGHVQQETQETQETQQPKKPAATGAR